MGWSVSAVDMTSRQIGQLMVVVDDVDDMMSSMPRLHSSLITYFREILLGL
jgi:hypothetical protein